MTLPFLVLSLLLQQPPPATVTVDSLDAPPRIVQWPGLTSNDSLHRAAPGPARVTFQLVVGANGKPVTGGFIGLTTTRPGLDVLAERLASRATFAAPTSGHRPVSAVLHLDLDLLLGTYTIHRQPLEQTVYYGGMVDEPPKLVGGKPLQYPDSLRHRGVEGDVSVQLIVDATGKPEPATIAVVGAADPGLNQAAYQFMTTAVFVPARLKDKKVRCLVVIPVGFHLMRGSR